MKTQTKIFIVMLTGLIFCFSSACGIKNPAEYFSLSETSTEVNTSSESKEQRSEVAIPETISEQGEYFWNNATVYSVINVSDSKDLQNGQETITLLDERGFNEYAVTYECSDTGEYQGKAEASDHLNDKSPMYQTYYISSNEEVWTIFVINGKIFANPVSYNLQSGLSAPLLISETKELTSYDYQDNLFLELIPDESVAIIKTVETINAETLDKLTIEEINKQ